jgi:hypothetical protein
MGQGKADYYRSGQWNFYCDLCGAKTKASDSMLTWNGLRVCKHHKEVRNPQDFLRGVRDDPSTPWTRPEKVPETFLHYCTLQGRNAIPGFAIPGCAIPAFVNLAFLPSVEMWAGWAISDTNGNPILDTNGQEIYPPGTPSVEVI